AARLDALRSEVGGARQAWWPREALPVSKREWTNYSSRVSALLERGARGDRQARRLLESPPVGWEEAARTLARRLPSGPPDTRRRYLVPVAAGGVALAVVAVWLVVRGSGGAQPEARQAESSPAESSPPVQGLRTGGEIGSASCRG